MNESKPYMSPQGYVDPASKYYIDRMWEEYHKMKEELADTKSKLGQMDDYVNEVLKPELADAKLKLKMANCAWEELDKSHAERAKLHDELIIAEGQRDQAKMRAAAAETERDALRTMLQMYNLGGYTDSVAIMTRALAAETERDALLKVYEAAEDFIGAQGTAYEDDQYRMLCGVVGAYNTTRGVHERRIG